MVKRTSIILKALAIAAVILPCGCRIHNDFPYPYKEGSITAFETEGMCGADGKSEGKATIDKNSKTVKLYVDDRVNLSAIRITKFEVTNDAQIVPDAKACLHPNKFPVHGFSYMEGDDTMTDFTSTVHFTLKTHQDFDWVVSVEQVIAREVEVEGQVGDAVIDPVNRTVIIYVSQNTDISDLRVKRFSIGGQHGKVNPDIQAMGSYDFSSLPTTVFVQNAWAEYSYEWQVFVYKTEAKTELTAQAFGRTVDAVVSGTKPGDDVLLLEYKVQGETNWSVVPASNIEVNGINYTARIRQLRESTTYLYRATAGEQTTAESSFTTTAKQQMENSGLDDWSLEGTSLWNPWAEGGSSYWDTGNRGATTVGASNSTPSDDTSTGSGKSAMLQSKFIVIKFAAGNIFTGQYVKTDGTNGVLDFGRPFEAFPSKMSFDFKYKSSPINRVGQADYGYLKGTPDECQVFIALADWDEPLRIKTKPSELSLFDKNDPHVIAYAEMITSADTREWTNKVLELKYNSLTRKPKYILVVCSSSRYGDFFTGGDSSLLQVDNFNLIYE